jgi:hypothetical protein
MAGRVTSSFIVWQDWHLSSPFPEYIWMYFEAMLCVEFETCPENRISFSSNTHSLGIYKYVMRCSRFDLKPLCALLRSSSVLLASGAVRLTSRVLWPRFWQCRSSGGWSPVSHRGGPASCPGQPMWWTKWQRNRLFSESFGFLLSISFRRRSIFTHADGWSGTRAMSALAT